jgi:hypothetical protein
VDIESSKPATGGRAASGGASAVAGKESVGGEAPESAGGNGGEPPPDESSAGSSDMAGGGAPDEAPAGGASSSEGGAPSTGGEPSKGGTDNAGGAPGEGGSSAGGDAAGGEDGGEPPEERPPGPPTVLILLDGSSSMFQPRVDLWDAALEALVGDGNPIEEFDDEIRFGFTNFRGDAAVHEETAAECASLDSVDFSFDNFGKIRELYLSLGADYAPTVKWETPTGFAIARSAEALLEDEASSGGRYIILITDGDPNTCQVIDPQCGQDQSIDAVQRAFKAGIRTYSIGIGEIANILNTGCVSSVSRCGAEHLQDLANAGQGYPVMAPPEASRHLACLAPDYEFRATYSSVGGPLPGLTAQGTAEIRSSFRSVLQQILEDSQK